MATTEPMTMLTGKELREIDEEVLMLLEEGRVTPIYCQKRLKDNGREVTTQYVQQRLARLEEHDHVENLFGTGLYKVTDDPRGAAV
jgi:hypothetical protein